MARKLLLIFNFILMIAAIILILDSFGVKPKRLIELGSSDPQKISEGNAPKAAAEEESNNYANDLKENLRIEDSRDNGALQDRPKAAIVILCRNNDLNEIKSTLEEFEQKFNSKFNYPYVFLNDKPFTQEFKESIKEVSKAEFKFAQVPKEDWGRPEWIDMPKAKLLMDEMGKKPIPYGGSYGYRHMCRFNSGFFWRQSILDEYDYYWRVEPGVHFYCDIDYDVFAFMRDNNKEYGFTIMLPEYHETVSTLWKTTKEFMRDHSNLIPEHNSLNYFMDKEGKYNLCHFWSNFEIGSLKFFRSEEYRTYFDYLDRAGGFYYERWGDAPVHSLAVGLFLRKDQVHFFNDIGYYHGPFTHCPIQPELAKKCTCDPQKSVDRTAHCLKRWLGDEYLWLID